jgi:signal peptidase II
MADAVAIPTASGRGWAWWFVSPLIGVLAVDLLTKSWLFSLPASAALPGWIERSYNTGVAWGMGNGSPRIVALVTALLIPLLAWIWWRHFRMLGRSENLAFGAVLGGALGNGVDRALTQAGQLGGVRDFIYVNLGFWPLNPWPTFNVADAGISVGFVVLAALSLLKPKTGVSPGTGTMGDGRIRG